MSHIIRVTNLVSDKYVHDWLLTEFNKSQIRKMQRNMDLAWHIINTVSKWPCKPIRIDNFKNVWSKVWWYYIWLHLTVYRDITCLVTKGNNLLNFLWQSVTNQRSILFSQESRPCVYTYCKYVRKWKWIKPFCPLWCNL